MSFHTIQIPPYGRVKIDVSETVAYINGDVPHLILRAGSDAARLPCGQCLPVDAFYAEIVNPFPVVAEVLIGRGLPVHYSPEVGYLTENQRANICSTGARYATNAGIAVSGRYGAGFLLKRGVALLRFKDRIDNGNDSRVVIFRGAKPSFMEAKPVGCMDLPFGLRHGNHATDNSFLYAFGPYEQSMVDAWVAGSGFDGTISEQFHDNDRTYVVTANDAVFYKRNNADSATSGGINVVIECQHLGASVGEFD